MAIDRFVYWGDKVPSKEEVLAPLINDIAQGFANLCAHHWDGKTKI